MSDKDEIFDYVMNNPENTNPAILREMLDNLGGGSSGGIFTVTRSAADGSLNKTFAEIKAAYLQGLVVNIEFSHTVPKTGEEIVENSSVYGLLEQSLTDPHYTVMSNGASYVASNATDYPVNDDSADK